MRLRFTDVTAIRSTQKHWYGKIQSAVTSSSHKATPAPPTPYIFILKALERAPLAKAIISILMKKMLSFTPFEKEWTCGNSSVIKCIHALHRCCLPEDTQLMTTVGWYKLFSYTRWDQNERNLYSLYIKAHFQQAPTCIISASLAFCYLIKFAAYGTFCPKVKNVTHRTSNLKSTETKMENGKQARVLCNGG